MYIVDRDRCLFLGSMLHGLKGYIEDMVQHDPQYEAVKGLTELLGCSIASLLVVGNSIISYQLSSRGEDYWLGFYKYFARRKNTRFNVFEEHLSFLKNTGFNRIRLDVKVKRLKKFYESRFAEEIRSEPGKFCRDLGGFNRSLARLLDSDWRSKTIVFATKMYYYLCRVCGYSVGSLLELPIPVDRRNAYLAITSCVVQGCGEEIGRCVEELVRDRKKVIEAWSIVCRASEIPCILLDTFTWITAGIHVSTRSVDEVYRALTVDYGLSDNPSLYDLVRELFRCVH